MHRKEVQAPVGAYRRAELPAHTRRQPRLTPMHAPPPPPPCDTDGLWAVSGRQHHTQQQQQQQQRKK
jgi:hypothetical protein